MSAHAFDTPELRAALDGGHQHPALVLRETVAQVLTDMDGDRDAVLDVMEELRTHFRRIGREDIEDTILEVMDFVAGWCSPHVAL